MITAQQLDRLARDLERNLGSLCSVARNTRCGAMRTNQRRAVGDALEFFAVARASAHEECIKRVIPRLTQNSAIDAAVRENLLSLYHAAAACHAIIDTLGRQWLEVGALETNDSAEMRATLERLQNVYALLLPAEERALYSVMNSVEVGTLTLHSANGEAR